MTATTAIQEFSAYLRTLDLSTEQALKLLDLMKAAMDAVYAQMKDIAEVNYPRL